MNDFEHIFGRDRSIVYYSVAGHKLLFNGYTGCLYPVISDSLNEILMTRFNDGDSNTQVPVKFLQEWFDGDYLKEKKIKRWHHTEGKVDPGNILIFPASGCNLACMYCINQKGTYGAGNEMMSMRTADNTIAWIRNLLKTNSPSNLRIELIGGEPTLNPEVTKYLSHELLGMNKTGNTRVHVRLVTNGINLSAELLDMYENFKEFASIGLSIDGNENRHNRHRIDKKGNKTFLKVIHALNEIKKRDIRYTVTAVVPYPFDFIEAFEELREYGIRFIEIKTIDYHIFGQSNGFFEDDSKENYPFKQDFDLWREKYIAYNIHILSLLEDKKNQIKCERDLLLRRYKTAYFEALTSISCPAGISTIGIAPDGMIYPCISFFAHDDYAIGSVLDGFSNSRLDRYYRELEKNGQMILDNKKCQNCFASLYCRGICYVKNLEQNGNIGAIDEKECYYRREKLKIDLFYLGQIFTRFPEKFLEIGGKID